MPRNASPIGSATGNGRGCCPGVAHRAPGQAPRDRPTRRVDRDRVRSRSGHRTRPPAALLSRQSGAPDVVFGDGTDQLHRAVRGPLRPLPGSPRRWRGRPVSGRRSRREAPRLPDGAVGGSGGASASVRGLCGTAYERLLAHRDPLGEGLLLGCLRSSPSRSLRPAGDRTSSLDLGPRATEEQDVPVRVLELEAAQAVLGVRERLREGNVP